MHRISKLCAAALLLLSSRSSFAQDDVTFRADTRLVVLHASVFDKAGKLVTTLPQDQFKVFENNVAQSIRFFRREDIPVSLGIVIDNSGSMRDKRQKVEAAALALVKNSNKRDEVAVVNFNDDAYLDSGGFTADVKKLEEALEQINSRGGTAMRDAMSMTLDFVSKEGKRDKKVILVVTDGDDTSSTGITQEKLIEKLHKMPDVIVYAIGILTDDSDRRANSRAKRALEQITRSSGGAAFFPTTLAEVEAIAVQVAHDIRNQYVIAYSPVNQTLDGTFRNIKVNAGNGRYSVRTRTGYFAAPDAKKTAAPAPPGNN
jgi:VWFA-related protein